MVGGASVRRLNLGCGRDHRADYLNVDSVSDVEPDLLWDLDSLPLPLPDGHFSEILALDVVEHLSSIVAFMGEAHRLLVDGGELRITTPHFSCSNTFRDPTHRWHLSYFSFDYFTDEHPLAHYSKARFRVVHRQIAFHNSLVNRLVSRLANRYPERYEQRYAWSFPAWFLEFRLAAVKGGSAEPVRAPG